MSDIEKVEPAHRPQPRRLGNPAPLYVCLANYMFYNSSSRSSMILSAVSSALRRPPLFFPSIMFMPVTSLFPMWSSVWLSFMVDSPNSSLECGSLPLVILLVPLVGRSFHYFLGGNEVALRSLPTWVATTWPWSVVASYHKVRS
jgi:hypothetical protein